MRCTTIYTALAAAFMAVSAWAQPQLTCTREVENMGEIMFQVPAKVTFTFRNTGDRPLVLTGVTPSCGCTKVQWSADPVPVGAEGQIEALYDARMLGVFQKDLEVYSNASEEPLYLHFQGRVVTKLSDYSGTFPIDLGEVRLNTNNIEFDDVNRGDQPVAELQVVNMGRKNYKPQLMHLPPYLTARYQPEVLSGGRIGRIQLRLDSEKLNSMGLTQTSIYLSRKLGDRISEENEISVSAVLLPHFDALTASQRALAPRLVLSADTLKMGSMGSKRKKSLTIQLRNDGQRTLVVRSLQVFNKSLNVSLSDRNIEPGKAAKLKVTVQAQYLKHAKASRRVLLITNDPDRPKVNIEVEVTN